jgi:PTS system nitrogen regulatory IIA component
MDLKIDDVAQLMSVSEETVQKWLLSGKIPAYRISDEYRFSRIEIENWMMSSKLDQENFSSHAEKQIYPTSEEKNSSHTSRGGHQQFNLYRALHKGDVLVDIEGSSKQEVIRSTLNHMAPQLGFDAEVVSELFLDREKLMSTSLGHGVAVPHSRDFVLRSPGSDAVIVVFPKEPIAYDALDGEPVHTLFFLLSSDDKRHLQLLAKIAHLIASEDALRVLKQKLSKDSLLQFIMNWEGQLHL